jgi:predicted dinucleotide-binding enzyme
LGRIDEEHEMSDVTIFGDGNVGSAIAGVLRTGGASVKHFTTADTDAVVDADIVVLAVPYAALAGITSSYADQLAGKIVVDITNPVNVADFDSLTVSAGSSAAVELAENLPSTPFRVTSTHPRSTS